MKKLFAIFAVLCLLISMASCSLIQYATMEVEDMLELPDDEMIVALLMHLGSEDFASLNEVQKVIYTAAALEMEVLNGGMVQFLSNEGPYAAPYVCTALEKLGANEHLALLNQCLEETGVNLADLSVFCTDDMEAFSALYEIYNFDAFDNAYVESLPSMPEYIRAYATAHLADL